jgi:hypothetical protein
MRSFWSTRGDSYYLAYPAGIHPVLNSFADECCGTLARLFAYVGVLILLAIVGIHLWDRVPAGEAVESTAPAG